MKRAMARELCMKILYEMNMQKKYDSSILLDYLEDEAEQIDNQKEYFTTVVNLFLENKDRVDGVIDQYSIGWNVSRMAKVDLAILRLAVTEMLFIDSIPNNVSINEALELAKRYSTEESSPFINGILDKVVNKGE